MYLYTDLYCHKLLVQRERMPLIFIILRKILNVFLFLVSLTSVILFAFSTKKFFPLLLFVVFLMTAVPIIMGDGVSTILRERFIAENRIRYGLPVQLDMIKIIGGYSKIFSVLWLFPTACFLIPGGDLYVGVMPPILLTSILVLKLIEHTWLIFGLSKKKYWSMHICALISFSALAISVRSIIGY